MNIDINNNYTNKDFGDALKEFMEDRKLSYNQLAYKCKLSPQFLQQIVTKKVLPPKDKFVILIAKALGVTPEYFREYRNRRLAEKLDTENMDLDNYDIPLSDKEAKYLKKIVEEHFKNKKK